MNEGPYSTSTQTRHFTHAIVRSHKHFSIIAKTASQVDGKDYIHVSLLEWKRKLRKGQEPRLPFIILWSRNLYQLYDGR
ncbi:hypothetical protein Naga_101048g3 [Nannochloropsis gaditana]|uniref:Uncharacterized protein n=1 Tax=Nannochloropsis gaditana TaxID=72520 RepID=W7TUZ2_9STRA|nr:hypothetical protein Naga_101048g3 [Nannochloropsis gaditana]